ncbi:MAG TPA: hypothetical protein PKE06_15345 [Flavilitoribacter sp.]|nr:hypothetical protein [Flavilitoribacter sp.]HMQ86582.1 hypothetical protein [Flavilitoribacter sp.]
MAKKRFTDNLMDLFSDVEQEQSVSPGVSVSGADESQNNARKNAQKDFTASLQSFLAEAFEESLENQLADPAPKTPRPKRPRSSLDMLIRSTLEPASVDVKDPNTRRVTFAFDPSKLEKLRTIARLEKAMLKDIIDDIVAEFIQDYEARKGKLGAKQP